MFCHDVFIRSKCLTKKVLEGRIIAGRIDNKSEWKNYQNVTNRFSGNAEKKVAIWSGTKTSGSNRDKKQGKKKKNPKEV